MKNLNNFSDVRTVLGVVAKDPVASKQNTTSAKILNSILHDTKTRVRNTTPDRSSLGFNNSTNGSHNTTQYRRPLKHNNSSSNLQDSSTNVSKHKVIDCDNLGKSDHKSTPNLRDSSTEGRKTHTPMGGKSGLRFFRNPSTSSTNQHLQMKPHYSSLNEKGERKSGSMDRPVQQKYGEQTHSPLLR